MFDWKKNAVCYIEGPKDAYVLLGIRPERLIDKYDNSEVVIWYDATHQRAFPLQKVVVDIADLFVFEDNRDQRFNLQPMTAELYEQRVRPKTKGPALKTDEDVQSFFLDPWSWDAS